jgi:DeoR/GlpR family transcriptional regulator of sugar metabolism
MRNSERFSAEAYGATGARRSAIARMAREQGGVRVADISRRFGISEVSIRRDLAVLEEQGLLRRVHGGAVSLASAPGPQSFDSRLSRRPDEKRRIGQAAAQLVQQGDSIILDSGTTVAQVARYLASLVPERLPLTVITGSLPAFGALEAVREIQVFVLGGIYQRDFQTLVGPQTLANLRGFHVDRLFLGADGLTLAHGVTTADILEAEVSRAMVQIADRIIVVADSSKVDNAGFTSVIPLREVTTLVTDTGAPAQFVARLRAEGVEVILA